MTEPTAEMPQSPIQIETLDPEQVTIALTNIAQTVVGLRAVVQQLIVGGQNSAQILQAHKTAIVDLSRELNRVSEEQRALDARIDVVKSWIKDRVPAKPLTGVDND